MLEPLWNITVGALLDKMADEFPENDAVVYTQIPYHKTYYQFNQECRQIAKAFMAMGIKKGDKVAIWATNYPQWLVTMFATAKIGAILVTVNTNYKIYELEYLLNQSDSTTLVLIDGFKDSNYVEIIQNLNPQLKNSKPGDSHFESLPFLKNIIYIGDNNTPAGMYNWNEIGAMGDMITDKELDDLQSSLDVHDVINMQYTSGTTGFPKGVMLTHYNIVNNGKSIGDRMKFTEKDRLCIPVPLFHCFGCVLAVMASVTHATAMIPIISFQTIPVMKAIHEQKCTALHGVPTMFIAILEHPDFLQYNFSSLRTGIMAGSPCPTTIMQRVVDEMNMHEITIVYGLTEASPGCTQTTTDDPLELRVNTVGRAFDYVECRVIDPETGKDMPCNEPGEFIARGYNIMKGYYKMPEATAGVIDADGWLHTGDMASVDENGYFKITGRIKDMIIRGGENIYPKEIEDFIYTHPTVSDVQVIGVPSKRYGEEIMAYIVLKDGMSASEEEIQQYVRGHMARYKTPKYVCFIDHLPVTASGKIQKYKLREMAVEHLGIKVNEIEQ